MLQRIKDLGKCDLVPKKVKEIVSAKDDKDRPLIKLDDGSEIEARLIIGSDGENSLTRNSYGIDTFKKEYN